jgi:hypothetical protein
MFKKGTIGAGGDWEDLTDERSISGIERAGATGYISLGRDGAEKYQCQIDDDEKDLWGDDDLKDDDEFDTDDDLFGTEETSVPELPYDEEEVVTEVVTAIIVPVPETPAPLDEPKPARRRLQESCKEGRNDGCKARRRRCRKRPQRRPQRSYEEGCQEGYEEGAASEEGC